jgi:hypothetical protein
MKTLRMMVFLTVAAAVVLGGQISSGEAAAELGNYCWGTPNGSITRLAVIDVGGGTYLVAGKTTHLDGTVTVESGSAQVVGANVIISGTGTRETATETRATTSRAVLDATTLNGTFERLRITHLKSDPTSTASVMRPDPEAATFMVCPQ